MINHDVHKSFDEPIQGPRLIGQSPAIQEIKRFIKMVAPTDSVVLIHGKSGTGKEVVARQIHAASKRKGASFVPLNCAAIPKELLESELFGHEKGSFTGAHTARLGRFELASQGTIFLDEIGDMPLDMQVKILRVLQEKTFERVGGNQSIKMKARIIAATNINLEKAVEEGRFREDLYYRLNVFPIAMPTLNQRKEDLTALIEELIKELNLDTGSEIRLTPESLLRLHQHEWPGNIRELGNLLERLSILYPGQSIQPQDLPEPYRDSKRVNESFTQVAMQKPVQFSQHFNLKEHLNEVERRYIQKALEQSEGVVAHAAQLLGLRRTTLVEKLRKLKLDQNASDC